MTRGRLLQPSEICQNRCVMEKTFLFDEVRQMRQCCRLMRSWGFFAGKALWSGNLIGEGSGCCPPTIVEGSAHQLATKLTEPERVLNGLIRALRTDCQPSAWLPGLPCGQLLFFFHFPLGCKVEALEIGQIGQDEVEEDQAVSEPGAQDCGGGFDGPGEYEEKGEY